MKIFKAFKWYFRIKSKLNERIGDKYYKRYNGGYWNGSKEKLIERLDELVVLQKENRRQSDSWCNLYKEYRQLVLSTTHLKDENATLKARMTELKYTRYM